MDLVKALAELPAAYHQLHLFRLPGSRQSDTGSRQKHSTLSTRAPLVLTVLDLLDERLKDAEPTRDDYEIDRLAGARRNGILPTLSRWVRLVDGELWDQGHVHVSPPSQVTVDGECAFLTAHAAWIIEQPYGQQMTDESNRMLRDCHTIIGTEQQIKLTCNRLGCGWPVEERYGGAAYHCTGCGQNWGRLELHRMAIRKQPKPLQECAKLAGVSERTLRRYVADKRLHRVARDRTVDLFDIDQVMKATLGERYRETAIA